MDVCNRTCVHTYEQAGMRAGMYVHGHVLYVL